MLFIGHTIRRLFHQNALSFDTIWRAVFYVDNALMIISWKIYVRIIQMQNIILYVVAVSSRPHPLFFSSFSILYPLGTNVTTWCYLKMPSINSVCLIFKHCIGGKYRYLTNRFPFKIERVLLVFNKNNIHRAWFFLQLKTLWTFNGASYHKTIQKHLYLL